MAVVAETAGAEGAGGITDGWLGADGAAWGGAGGGLAWEITILGDVAAGAFDGGGAEACFAATGGGTGVGATAGDVSASVVAGAPSDNCFTITLWY